MRNAIILALASILFLGCKKKCIQTGQFDIPLYVTITKVPKIKLLSDTILVTASVPFKTQDLRLQYLKVNTEPFKPTPFYCDMSANPSVGLQPIPYIVPYQDGYFDVLPVKGKRLRYLYFDFEKTDTAWVVSFKLVPKRYFDGIFFFRWSRIEYKDKCMQLDPISILVNTPKSHNLIRERIEVPLSPWENDVFFYVE